MGGGYGTGREVVEFFTRYGVLGGLMGISAAACLFALVLASTYEFARVFKVYNYRNFFSELIGPFWIFFEILYLLLFLLVLGVISSAAGSILEDEFGIASIAGMGGVLVLVVTLVFFGRKAVEGVLTLWSLGMYLVFAFYFYEVMSNDQVNLHAAVSEGTVEDGWLKGGVLYAMYNLAIAPVLLFSSRSIQTRFEALGAGLFAGILVMVPAVLFHISYAAGYPDVLNQAVPNYWMMSQYTSTLLKGIFLIALLGTLVETGAGLVQGLIERIESVLKPNNQDEDSLSHPVRAGIALATLSLGGVLGSLGIVPLIAQGYSALSMGFAVVYIIPICTLGIVKIIKR
jgi:uncharacterized membrane protein YkvI